MRRILSFSPLTVNSNGSIHFNSLTFKPVYYARFTKKNGSNNKSDSKPEQKSSQGQSNQANPENHGQNQNNQRPNSNLKITGPNNILKIAKSGNTKFFPFYLNNMVNNTRNPSLPTITFEEPFDNDPSAQSEKQMDRVIGTYTAKNFLIHSSKDYTKILLKKYKIVQALKTTNSRSQMKKNISHFKMITQGSLYDILKEPQTRSMFIRIFLYSVFAFAIFLNFLRRTYFSKVPDTVEEFYNFSDLSDTDIQSKINEIKQIRVQSNRFRDNEMVVVLKEEKHLNFIQKAFDSIGFNVEKNKTMLFEAQNPNLILDGLQKAQQNKQQSQWIKIKPLLKAYSPYDAFWDTLMLATPFFGIALTYWIFKKVNPDSMIKGLTSNKKSMKIESTKDIKVRFKDVAGMQNAKKEVTQFVDFLKNSEKYVEMGAKIPKGALLTGPPGTGKTMLAKACAGQAGTSFFYVSGSQFVEMFVGLGASRVRELFSKARQEAPSIIFIDQIDAIGKKRETSRNQEKDSTLNQMLVEMDGFSTSETVIVLAATNRKDILDSALTRPGRFDRMVEITLPELKAREEIFMVHLSPLKVNPNRKLTELAERLASLTPGFSGADIANLCNEAAIIATRKKREYIEDADFEEASERIMAGYIKKGLSNQKTKKRVAYHEAGHAVCGWYLRGGDPLVKLTIIPRSKGALGYAQYLPKTAYIRTKSELIDQISIMLGGTTSEQIFLGDMSSGNSDDLQKVYSIARRMVTQFGMGVRTYNMTLDEQTYVKKESQKLCNIMDEQMLSIVKEATERARNILNEKKEIVELLAKELLEKETLNNEDILRIMGERPAFN